MNQEIRIAISTGDYSGQLYGEYIIAELLKNPNVKIGIWGDTSLAINGCIHLGTPSIGLMGWTDVILRPFTIIETFKKCKKAILAFRPHIFLAIDYAGFNLRMIEWAHKKQIATSYFIPPKVWASREARISKLKLYCDQIINIYPFEQVYFSTKGLTTLYFGNPYFEHLNLHTHPHFKHKKNTTLALLPGSRIQEIKYLVPIFMELISTHQDKNFIISRSPSVKEYIQTKFKKLPSNATWSDDTAIDILSKCDMAVICSGTATLDAVALNVPQIVVYKTSLINYLIAKNLILTKYISLPNLILDQAAIPELIQDNCQTNQISMTIDLLMDPDKQLTMLKSYHEISVKLSCHTSAEKIANAILLLPNQLNSKSS